LAGLLLGILGTYWYLTEGDRVREVVEDFWSRASRPPAAARGPR
jgi:hypothetical protein